MKPWLPFLIAFTLSAVSSFPGEPTIIKPDPLQADGYQITDTKGTHRGIIKLDPIDSRRHLILNRDGDPIGYVRPPTLPTSTTRYDVFTPQGERTGTVRQDPLRGDRYRFNGKTIKREILRLDRWAVE